MLHIIDFHTKPGLNYWYLIVFYKLIHYSCFPSFSFINSPRFFHVYWT